MTIYIVTVIGISLLGMISQFTGKKRVFLYMACGWLIIVMGMRAYTVGTDTQNYGNIFSTLGSMSLNGYISLYGYNEILFYCLNKLLYTIGFTFRQLLLVEAVLIVVPLGKFIKENSSIYWLSLLFYIGIGNLNQAMNVSRQYIAIGFILISMLYIDRKQPIVSLLYFVLAIFFHRSSLFALLLYPVIKLKGKKYNRYFVLLLPIGYIIRQFIMPRIIPYISAVYYHRAQSGEGVKFLILLLCILIILLHLSEQKKESCEALNRAVRLTSTTIFFHLFIGQIVAIGRIEYFFSVPLFIVLPNVMLRIFDEKSKPIVIALFTCLIIVYYLMMYLPGGASMTVPYSFGQL